jgi:hypothetical protein
MSRTGTPRFVFPQPKCEKLGPVANFRHIVDVSTTIFTWRQQQDAHVRHGQSATSSSRRDNHELEIRDKGAQHAHWDGQEAEQGQRLEVIS